MLEYKNDKWKALIALFPTLVFMIVFTFYPIINTLVTAFMEGYTFNVWRDNANTLGWLDHFGETDVIGGGYDADGNPLPKETMYIGLGFGNFISVLKDSTFQAAFKNTVIMVVISVPVTVIIALLISVALNNIKKFQGLFQTIYFLPYVTNTIALGLVFSALFASKSGLINSMLVSMGAEPVAWIRALGDKQPTYLTSMFVLMLYTIWNGLAFKILVFLSGMQSIDKQYYQAAQVDATPKWRVFRKITVPLLSPMIAYITITSFIGAFKTYSSVIAVFNGEFGPSNDKKMLYTMVGYVYDKLQFMSNTGEIAKASAASLILFAIIMLITILQMWVSKKKVHY